MCRLAALSAACAVSISPLMAHFFYPLIPDNLNLDGWGIAHFVGKECLLIKGPEVARESLLLKALIESADIESHQAILHVRRATRGGVSLENSHPFVRELWGIPWAFVHHGDISWITRSECFEPCHFYPVGETDTEFFFCWLLSRLREQFKEIPPWETLGFQISTIAQDVHRHKKLNFILATPHLLLAFYGGHEKMFYCQWNAQGTTAILISSTPLPLGESWLPFRPGELKIMKNGAIKQELCNVA